MSAHKDSFDRRIEDVNVRALAARINSVENAQRAIQLDMMANTRLTTQVHEACFGAGEDAGMHQQVKEMYQIFESARNGLRMLESIGKFGLRVGRGVVSLMEALAKVAKPLFWIAAATAAAVTYTKTGAWQMPAWWIALFP